MPHPYLSAIVPVETPENILPKYPLQYKRWLLNYVPIASVKPESVALPFFPPFTIINYNLL